MRLIAKSARTVLTAWLLAVALHAVAAAQPPPPDAPVGPRHLPADLTTAHSLPLADRTLTFHATAGSLRLFDEKHAPLVDLAFVAYRRDGQQPAAERPVTFAFNGGPGYASGWLQVGAIGPWRIPLGGAATAPSASPEPIPNDGTWLDFTDLVFIDPAGTGHSQVPGSDAAQRQVWSVDGDIAYLAAAIRRWLDRYDRGTSPKYLLGESYGGFRTTKLVRELAANQGVGVAGLLLVSPALDFGGHSSAFDPFHYVTRLPSMAAAARAARGPLDRGRLADVEQYAATDYLVDLVRGERDPAAIARRSARVAELTGLDPVLVRRHDGMLDDDVFLHELARADGRIASAYDATITKPDPFPDEDRGGTPDPMLEALKAPVSSAMAALYATRLNWRPDDTPYRLFNRAANRQWDWGHGMGGRPEAMRAMRTALALDPRFSVLIAHGLFDLVTPYFGTQLLLDQVPLSSGGDRIDLVVYPGGHMFYIDDASRAAWRAAARAVVERD